MYLTTSYEMSDSTTWYQSTVHEDGALTQESWANEKGEAIDGTPPEASAEEIAAYDAANAPVPIRLIDKGGRVAVN